MFKNNLIELILLKRNRYDPIQAFKKGNKIKIKKENKGKFTKYCNGKVTDECISKGKNSPNPSVRKMAIFAQNSKKWKHG